MLLLMPANVLRALHSRSGHTWQQRLARVERQLFGVLRELLPIQPSEAKKFRHELLARLFEKSCVHSQVQSRNGRASFPHHRSQLHQPGLEFTSMKHRTDGLAPVIRLSLAAERNRTPATALLIGAVVVR